MLDFYLPVILQHRLKNKILILKGVVAIICFLGLKLVVQCIF